jgi:hypothetical protein
MQVRLNAREIETLYWLASHGYDGGIVENSSIRAGVLTIDNMGACAVSENVDSDPHAFLACCGDRDLAEKLIAIVTGAV